MSYSYDYLSRLSSSTFHNYSDAGVISGTNNYNENLTYDLRGNIQTLQLQFFIALYENMLRVKLFQATSGSIQIKWAGATG